MPQHKGGDLWFSQRFILRHGEPFADVYSTRVGSSTGTSSNHYTPVVTDVQLIMTNLMSGRYTQVTLCTNEVVNRKIITSLIIYVMDLLRTCTTYINDLYLKGI